VISSAENYLFPFEKFMHADESLHIFSMSASFAPETWRECEKLQRQRVHVNYFVHVISHHRHFAGAGKIFAVLSFIEIFFALWQITCAEKRFAPHERWHTH